MDILAIKEKIEYSASLLRISVMALPIELGIKALEAFRSKINHDMFSSIQNQEFEEVIGMSIDEFLIKNIELHMVILRQIQSNPDREAFSYVINSLNMLGGVIKAEGATLKMEGKEESPFLSILKSCYSITMTYVQEYQKNNFH